MDIFNYKTKTLVDVAYMALKNDVAKNILAQGQKIILRELSERYGISETPIKQALNRLVSEGFVESIPRKGMKVRVVKWEELNSMFEVRYMVETFFIKKIINHVKQNPQVLQKLSDILCDHESMIQNISDINEYYRNYDLDWKFHRLFIQCSGNKEIEQLYNNVGIHRYMFYVYGKQGLDLMMEGLAEHRAIYNALAAHDEDLLKECVKIHVENARRKIYRAIYGNEEGLDSML